MCYPDPPKIPKQTNPAAPPPPPEKYAERVQGVAEKVTKDKTQQRLNRNKLRIKRD